MNTCFIENTRVLFIKTDYSYFGLLIMSSIYDIVVSPTFIITLSIILVTVFVSKVLHTGALALPAHLISHLILPLGRAKPLDPNVWKEFPLEKKIQVSPNTAMYAFDSSRLS